MATAKKTAPARKAAAAPEKFPKYDHGGITVTSVAVPHPRTNVPDKMGLGRVDVAIARKGKTTFLRLGTCGGGIGKGYGAFVSTAEWRAKTDQFLASALREQEGEELRDLMGAREIGMRVVGAMGKRTPAERKRALAAVAAKVADQEERKAKAMAARVARVRPVMLAFCDYADALVASLAGGKKSGGKK